jgi:hypothetical protein
MGKLLHQLMDEQLEGKFADRTTALARFAKQPVVLS